MLPVFKLIAPPPSHLPAGERAGHLLGLQSQESTTKQYYWNVFLLLITTLKPRGMLCASWSAARGHGNHDQVGASVISRMSHALLESVLTHAKHFHCHLSCVLLLQFNTIQLYYYVKEKTFSSHYLEESNF